MLFPDQSPVVLIVLLVGLLALGLLAAARDLTRQPAGPGLACPKCGHDFDPQRWTRHNERTLYHGRYTVTPLYTCPRCGETVRMASS
jgi:DNA-directed RNA polymerase subunit RPC12/RpoP